MKKIAAVLFAALLATAGLVAGSSTSAQAACPYTGCIATSISTSAPSSIPRKTKLAVRVNVTAVGNATPQYGKVRVVARHPKGGKVRRNTVNWRGFARDAAVGPLKRKGNWNVTAQYLGKDGKYADSPIVQFRVRVKKR